MVELVMFKDMCQASLMYNASTHQHAVINSKRNNMVELVMCKDNVSSLVDGMGNTHLYNGDFFLQMLPVEWTTFRC